MGWEGVILPRLVSLVNGNTAPYAENLAVGLDAPGAEMSRNHVGMAIAGEALRALRALVADVLGGIKRDEDLRWNRAKVRLIAYLRDEFTNGLWGGEVLCPTPHDAYHLAIAMFARLAAVESQDPELLRLTADHCRALGRLCATLSDPTGEVLSAGVRVPLAKGGKEQRRPVHSALTEFYRYLTCKTDDERFGKLLREPMYVGLKALELVDEDERAGGVTPWVGEQPGPVPMSRPVIVHRWPAGHQVEIPRRGNETGLAKGSQNPNGTCDWLRAEYGKGKKGGSLVTFGMLWQQPAPPVPKVATKIELGPAVREVRIGPAQGGA
jgi:hypothetical protein